MAFEFLSSKKAGIDLGTANILVYVKGHGIVINEPSVVARHNRDNAIVAVGNEARGVSGELRMSAIEVTIPTVGVESLNAAVAAGIMLYEARRQRMLHT